MGATHPIYIGQQESPLVISTGAGTLMYGLDGPISFKTKTMQHSIECNSLLLPAGTSVIIDIQGATIANCTLDPAGADFATLSALMQHRAVVALYQIEYEPAHIKTFLNTYHSPLDLSEIRKTISKILQLDRVNGIAIENTNHDIDPRISDIIHRIQNTACENPSLSYLAERVNMSPSRLIQLFKQQTGLPIRRYRLWCRLYLTVLGIGQGKSLTVAAVEAGFNDSPHFNHTFRSMLGMTPSFILSQVNQLQIILPENNRAEAVAPITNTIKRCG